MASQRKKYMLSCGKQLVSPSIRKCFMNKRMKCVSDRRPTQKRAWHGNQECVCARTCMLTLRGTVSSFVYLHSSL